LKFIANKRRLKSSCMFGRPVFKLESRGTGRKWYCPFPSFKKQ